jgi:DNA-binding beta-propeller fold protein YncE
VIHGCSYFVANYGGGSGTTVGEYDATTGDAIKASFITGLNGPTGLALSSNNLFVANFSGGTVGEYDATTGDAIKASFITGLNGPEALAVPSVPEPSTWSMIAVGGVALLGMMLWKKHRTT